MAEISSATFQMTREMVSHWGWFLTFGIVLALLGVAAMIRSFAGRSGPCCSSDGADFHLSN